MVGSCDSSSCAGTTTAPVLKLMAVALSGARFPLPTLRLFFGKSFALALFVDFPRFIMLHAIPSIKSAPIIV